MTDQGVEVRAGRGDLLVIAFFATLFAGSVTFWIWLARLIGWV